MSAIDQWRFVEVHCEHHERPWKIASFCDMGDGWQEIEAASKERRIEQKRRSAEVDAMPPEDPAAPFDSNEWIRRAVPGGDRPAHDTRLADGKPTDPYAVKIGGYESLLSRVAKGLPPLPDPQEWRTFDLTCRRCKRKRRHATYRRRADKLFETFDQLVVLGKTTVTPEFLHQYETRRDN